MEKEKIETNIIENFSYVLEMFNKATDHTSEGTGYSFDDFVGQFGKEIGDYCTTMQRIKSQEKILDELKEIHLSMLKLNTPNDSISAVIFSNCRQAFEIRTYDIEDFILLLRNRLELIEYKIMLGGKNGN